MKKSIVALGIALALSGCASAADETLAAEPAALVEISPATEETAQPVRSNGGASTAATAHTGPCRRTSTPSVRRRDFPRWQWTAG